MSGHFLKTAASLFGKLLVAKIFGFILSATILMALSGMIGSLITQLCAVMLIIVLCFSSAWELGSKDANRAQIGQIKEDPWLGLKAGLLASGIDIVLAVLLLLTKAGVVGSWFPVLFGLLNSNFLPFHQSLLPTTLTVAEQSWGGYIASAMTVLIAPLSTAFGYRLGLTQVALTDTLLYTTPQAQERHALRVKARRSKRKNRFFR